jgi:lysophospholipase L1-like esterase
MKIYLTLFAFLCIKMVSAQAPAQSGFTTRSILREEMWYNTLKTGSFELDQSAYSVLKFTTNAANIKVIGWSNLEGLDAFNSRLRLKVDGVQQSPIHVTNGPNPYDVNLGNEGQNKVVEITVGLQTQPFGRNLTGVYGTGVRGVSYPSTASFSIITPEAPELLILGTSIMNGFGATNPDTDGIVALLRNTYNIKAAVHGWCAASMMQETNTQASRNELIDRIVEVFSGNANPKIWIERQTNDYGLEDGLQSAASYQDNTAALIDELKARLPNLKIYLQTAIVRTLGTGANQFGNVLSDYRAASSNIASTRTSFITLIDGLNMLSVSNLSDGLHPSTVGMSEYAQKMVAVLQSTNAVLPVHFSHITATCNHGVLLTWKTAQEINSDEFVIERSVDGRTWTTAGTVPANGNSSRESSYSFTDKNTGGFFRVVEVGKDGSKVISSMVKSACTFSNAIKVQPSVVSTNAVVSISSTKRQQLSLTVYNTAGAIVKQVETSITPGNNNITVDVSSLSNGIYTIKATVEGDTRGARIVKIN